MPDINIGFLLAQLVNLALLFGFPILIIIMIVVSVRRNRSRPALDALKERLARGQIDEYEFLRLRDLITDSALEKPKRAADASADDGQADDRSIDEDELERLHGRLK